MFRDPFTLPHIHQKSGFCFSLVTGFTWGRSQNLPKAILTIKDRAQLTTRHSNNCKHFNSKNKVVCECPVTREGWLGSENKRTFLRVDRSAGRDRPARGKPRDCGRASCESEWLSMLPRDSMSALGSLVPLGLSRGTSDVTACTTTFGKAAAGLY